MRSRQRGVVGIASGEFNARSFVDTSARLDGISSAAEAQQKQLHQVASPYPYSLVALVFTVRHF